MAAPPQEFVTIAAREAQRWSGSYGVAIPVELVLAIMAKENARFDPGASAREPDGELSRGLMQVKESTAKWLGLTDPRKLFDAATGIHYGVKYLGHQLRRYGGDVVRAIAAYNAGSAIRSSSSGKWINQSYVDRALELLAQFRRALAPVSVPGASVGASRKAPAAVRYAMLAAAAIAAGAAWWYLTRARRVAA